MMRVMAISIGVLGPHGRHVVVSIVVPASPRIEVRASDQRDVLLDLARLGLFAAGAADGISEMRLDASRIIRLSRHAQDLLTVEVAEFAEGAAEGMPKTVVSEVVPGFVLARAIWRALRAPERVLETADATHWQWPFPKAQMETLWQLAKENRTAPAPDVQRGHQDSDGSDKPLSLWMVVLLSVSPGILFNVVLIMGFHLQTNPLPVLLLDLVFGLFALLAAARGIRRRVGLGGWFTGFVWVALCGLNIAVCIPLVSVMAAFAGAMP